jgi:hypothetical protein
MRLFSLNLAYLSRLVGESGGKLGLHTYFAEHERRACAARFDLDRFFQDFALGLPNGLTRVHSTTRQPDVLAARPIADCATIYRSVSQAGIAQSDGRSCFHELISKGCGDYFHHQNLHLLCTCFSRSVRESAIHGDSVGVLTTQTMRTSPRLKVNAASADACWAAWPTSVHWCGLP